jgi:hypothetical protein
MYMFSSISSVWNYGKCYNCRLILLKVFGNIYFQLITAKLVHVGNSMPSSPDSSSDSSGGSPHHTFDGPNVEAENCLPGVVSNNYW